MRVTLLGAGTSIPHPDRSSPGLVVEVGDRLALVDPSAGSLGRMARHGYGLAAVRWVLVTHFHVDHTAGLAPFFFALRNPEYFTPGPVTLVGPPGLGDLYRRLAGVWGDWVRHDPELLELREVAEGEVELEGWSVRVVPVEHAEPSVGFRFLQPGSGVVAYTGDTDDCPGVVELLRGSEVAFVECSHPEGAKARGHLTPAVAGRLARQAGARRVVLVHRYPACDGHDLLGELRRTGFDGEAELGYDGMVVDS